jgi:hypothetical protein
MPSLSPLTSEMHHHVLDAPCTPLNLPVPPHGHPDACTRGRRRGQTRPGVHTHAPGRAWRQPWTRQSAPRLVTSARPSPPAPAGRLASTPGPRQTPPRAFPRPVAVEEDDDVRHSAHGRVTRATMLDHRKLF